MKRLFFALLIGVCVCGLTGMTAFGAATTFSTVPTQTIAPATLQPPAIAVKKTRKVKKGTLSFSPRNPRDGEEIKFSFKGFKSSCTIWDFGDGTKEKRKASSGTTHYYKQAGSYKVTIYADCAGTPSATATVTVKQTGRKISANPNQFTDRRPIMFKTNGFLSKNIQWDFGDGTKQTGGPSFQHTFLKPGKYIVKAWDFEGKRGVKAAKLICKIRKMVIKGNTGRARSISATPSLKTPSGQSTAANRHRSVRAGEYSVVKRPALHAAPSGFSVVPRAVAQKGKIFFSPQSPRDGEEIKFSFRGVNASNAIWDFGDGWKVKDKTPPDIKHYYQRAGTYRIKLYADSGRMPVAATTVMIQKADRKISANPNQFMTRRPVMFKTSGFLSKNIQWDFGDGTKQTGGPSFQHTFLKHGKYTVKAWDFEGKRGVKAAKLACKIRKMAVKGGAVSGRMVTRPSLSVAAHNGAGSGANQHIFHGRQYSAAKKQDLSLNKRSGALPTTDFNVGKPLITLFKSNKTVIRKGEACVLQYKFTGGVSAFIRVKDETAQPRIKNNIRTEKIPFLTETSLPVAKPGRYATGTRKVKPLVDTTYELHVENSHGTDVREVTVEVRSGKFMKNVASKIAISRFDFSPGVISPGQRVTLYYAYSAERSARIIEMATGKMIARLSPGDRSGKISLSPGTTTVYTLEVVSKNDTVAMRDATIYVTHANGDYGPKGSNTPLVLSFEAMPSSVKAGEACTLHYRITNAEAGVVKTTAGIKIAELTMPEIGRIRAGTLKVFPKKTTTYVIRLENPNGAVVQKLEVRVVGTLPLGNSVMRKAGIQKFEFDPPAISAGQTTEAIYAYTSAKSAKIIEKYTGRRIADLLPGTRSSHLSLKPLHTTVYTLEVIPMFGKKLTEDFSVVVKYPKTVYKGKPVIDAFRAVPGSVSLGQSATLAYRFKNAETAMIYFGNSHNGKLISGISTVEPGKERTGSLKVTPPGNSHYMLYLKNPNGVTTQKIYLPCETKTHFIDMFEPRDLKKDKDGSYLFHYPTGESKLEIRYRISVSTVKTATLDIWGPGDHIVHNLNVHGHSDFIGYVMPGDYNFYLSAEMPMFMGGKAVTAYDKAHFKLRVLKRDKKPKFIKFKADTTSIQRGQSVAFDIEVLHASKIMLMNGNTGKAEQTYFTGETFSGTRMFSCSPAFTTEYYLRAVNNIGETTSATVKVKVVDVPEAKIVSFKSFPPSAVYGDTVVLEYEIENVALAKITFMNKDYTVVNRRSPLKKKEDKIAFDSVKATTYPILWVKESRDKRCRWKVKTLEIDVKREKPTIVALKVVPGRDGVEFHFHVLHVKKVILKNITDGVKLAVDSGINYNNFRGIITNTPKSSAWYSLTAVNDIGKTTTKMIKVNASP